MHLQRGEGGTDTNPLWEWNGWAFCVALINAHAYVRLTNSKNKSEEDKTNRQVGKATAGPHRAPRILINSYIPGENDEKADAQKKMDETELQQIHRSIVLIASRRKYVK